jgi:hypothetical protein
MNRPLSRFRSQGGADFLFTITTPFAVSLSTNSLIAITTPSQGYAEFLIAEEAALITTTEYSIRTTHLIRTVSKFRGLFVSTLYVL